MVPGALGSGNPATDIECPWTTRRGKTILSSGRRAISPITIGLERFVLVIRLKLDRITSYRHLSLAISKGTTHDILSNSHPRPYCLFRVGLVYFVSIQVRWLAEAWTIESHSSIENLSNRPGTKNTLEIFSKCGARGVFPASFPTGTALRYNIPSPSPSYWCPQHARTEGSKWYPVVSSGVMNESGMQLTPPSTGLSPV